MDVVLEYLVTVARVLVVGTTAALFVEALWIIRLYREVERTLSKEKVHLLPRHVWTVAIGLLGMAATNAATVVGNFLTGGEITPSIFALPFMVWALYSLRLVRRFEIARLRQINERRS